MKQVEIRVRPVKRYVVTRFTTDGETGGSECLGEFDNIDRADEVGRAIAAMDENITFATVEDRREPVGVFTAYTSEQADALMDFVHGPSFPPQR